MYVSIGVCVYCIFSSDECLKQCFFLHSIFERVNIRKRNKRMNRLNKLKPKLRVLNIVTSLSGCYTLRWVFVYADRVWHLIILSQRMLYVVHLSLTFSSHQWKPNVNQHRIAIVAVVIGPIIFWNTSELLRLSRAKKTNRVLRLPSFHSKLRHGYR